MAWTNPRTWVAGELITASIGNSAWRDNLAYLKASPTFDGAIVVTGTTTGTGGFIGNLTGNISGTAPAGTLTGTTLAANVVSTSVTSVGALSSGSIASGFGNINNGANTLTTGAASVTTLNASGTITGNLTGNVTGNVSGTAPAGTLTGTTLAANVVSTSITSVGTVTSGTWSGLFGAVTGANLTNLTAANLAGTTLPSNIVSSSLTSVGALSSGSIASGFGNINIGASTLTAGATSVTTLNASGTITGNLTGNVTGNVSGTAPAGTLTGTTLASNVVTSSLTTVGALNSGSITSGFGSIDIGTDGVIAGGVSVSNNANSDMIGYFATNSFATGVAGLSMIAGTGGGEGTGEITTSAGGIMLVGPTGGSFQSLTLSSGDGSLYLAAESANRVTISATSVAVSTLLTVSGFGTHAFSAGSTGANIVQVANTTSGTGNYGAFKITGGTTDGYLYGFSQGYTTSGPYMASTITLQSAASAGLNLLASEAGGAIRFYSGGTTLRAQINTNGTQTWAPYGAGAATFDASGNITSVSDERFKDRIADLGYGLDEVLRLRPVQHGYNELSGLEREHLYGGFLAQDVRDVMPLAVGQNSDGYYTLADRPILGAVVTAIQQLAVRVAALEGLA